MEFPATGHKRRSERNGSPTHVAFAMPPDHPRGCIFIGRYPQPASPENPASIMKRNCAPRVFRFPKHPAVGIHPVAAIEIRPPTGGQAVRNPTPCAKLRQEHPLTVGGELGLKVFRTGGRFRGARGGGHGGRRGRCRHRCCDGFGRCGLGIIDIHDHGRGRRGRCCGSGGRCRCHCHRCGRYNSRCGGRSWLLHQCADDVL